MKSLNFKSWILKEFADYGFENHHSVKHKGGTKAHQHPGPIDPIDSHILIDELIRHNLGKYAPHSKMSDMVQWGEQTGAILIDISPIGSYKIITRRKISDLQGETAWVCKEIFPLNENEHNKNELSLAHNMLDRLAEINTEMIEGPAREFHDLEKLAYRLYAATKKEHPSYIMFPFALKKLDDHYYKLVFEYKGHGVEAPTSSRAEQFNIDLFWDRKKGLIRCWGYDILSQMRQHDWRVQPSEWDEYFSPHQKMDEIVRCVIRAFMTY